MSFDFFRNETPELVGVDSGAMIPVPLPLELSDTTLTVESRMAKQSEGLDLLFVHVDSLVMHTTSKTATTGRFSVLTNSTISHGSVSSLMSSLS